MFHMDTVAGFDILALGVIIGSALLFVSLVWVLVENRQFEDFKPAANRFETDEARPVAEGSPASGPSTPHAA